MEQDKTLQLIGFLEESLEKLLDKSKKYALAFSGGVDSSVIAKLMKDLGFKFKGYVVGTAGSEDSISAAKVAKEIGFELKEIIVSEQDIRKAMDAEKKILDKEKLKSDDVSISFNLPLYFVAKNCIEKEIIIGQGPDAMLGGYKRYLEMDKEKAILEMRKDMEVFFNSDFLQNKKTLEFFEKKAVMPFIEDKIIDFCLKLPYESRIFNGIRKHILRKAAEKIGLSHETAFREKKAAQYGSGIMKAMMKIKKK